MMDFPLLSLIEELSSNQEVNEKGVDFLFLGLNQRAIITIRIQKDMSMNGPIQSPDRLYTHILGEAIAE